MGEVFLGACAFISLSLGALREVRRKTPIRFHLWLNTSTHITGFYREQGVGRGFLLWASLWKETQLTSHSECETPPVSWEEAVTWVAPAPGRPGGGNHLPTGERRACGQGWSILEDGERVTKEGKDPILSLHPGKTPGRKEAATLGSGSVWRNLSFEYRQ